MSLERPNPFSRFHTSTSVLQTRTNAALDPSATMALRRHRLRCNARCALAWFDQSCSDSNIPTQFGKPRTTTKS